MPSEGPRTVGAPFPAGSVAERRRRPRASSGASRRAAILCLGVVGVLLLSPLSAAGAPASPAPATTSKIAKFDAHIDHIVFLMQENHAFDSEFGVYCPTKGPYCSSAVNGVPSGTCVPMNPSNPSAGCVVPYNFTAANESLPHDLAHTWNSSHQAWNHGAMNGFYAADGLLSFGHYNGSTVPVYWDLAEEYGLGEDYFSGALTYSLANHWYEQAARPPTESFIPEIGQNASASVAVDHLYLDEANRTSTFEGELLNSSVTWKEYDFTLLNYSAAISSFNLNYSSGTAYDYWNPLAARAQSYAAGVASHFVPRSQFFADAHNGTLPDVSWIIPNVTDSDHPPENITNGQTWVASVVDAIEASPDWNTTVLFISDDEYGGFYDHVSPPVVSAYGDGFRVPLLAISPWVKQGYVDDQYLTVSSILHLMEERFHLACLGVADCHAALPLEMFNFGLSHPRTPIYIPPFANATYPMPLQSSGKLPRYVATVTAPPGVDQSAYPNLPGVDWS